MALTHATPGEVISIRPLGENLRSEVTRTLLKTDRLQVIRLVVPADKEIPYHQVNGDITIQCLEGQAGVQAGGVTRVLQAGEMLFLNGREPHAVRGIEDGSLLVTILLD